jgi:hypothetical protein
MARRKVATMPEQRVTGKLRLPIEERPERLTTILEKMSDDERRAQIWERRLKGFSYDAIYRDMLRTFGTDQLPANWSPKHVYTDCAAVLAQVQNEYRETAAEMVGVELGRFDELLAGVWPMAVSGDLQAIDRALDISKERRKMMGLDNPDRIQIDWRFQVADLLQKGTIRPEDVVAEFGEEALIEVNQLLLEKRD